MPSCQEAANLAERLEGDLRTVVSNLDRVKRPFQRWIRALQDEGVQALVDGVDAEAALQEAIDVGEQGFPGDGLAGRAGRQGPRRRRDPG